MWDGWFRQCFPCACLSWILILVAFIISYRRPKFKNQQGSILRSYIASYIGIFSFVVIRYTLEEFVYNGRNVMNKYLQAFFSNYTSQSQFQYCKYVNFANVALPDHFVLDGFIDSSFRVPVFPHRLCIMAERDDLQHLEEVQVSFTALLPQASCILVVNSLGIDTIQSYQPDLPSHDHIAYAHPCQGVS